MFDKVLGFVRSLATAESAKLALIALCLTVGIYGFVCFLLGFALDWKSGFRVIPPGGMPPYMHAGVAVFPLVFFLFVWFLLYSQNVKEYTDVYSVVRKRLAGGWLVTYQQNVSTGPRFSSTAPNIACRISITPTQKLQLEFDIKENDVYESGRQVITNVAIRHDYGEKYELIYYYSGFRHLRDKVASKIIEDGDFNSRDGLDIEIFGILEFLDMPNETKISSMQGHWYDLNGRVTQVYALLDKLNDHSAGQVFTPEPLSKIDLPSTRINSKRGGISFTRIE